MTGTLGTTMTGGALVVTYNGKELYTFLSDSPGQVTGDGVAGFSVAKVAAASGASNNTPAPRSHRRPPRPPAGVTSIDPELDQRPVTARRSRPT